jgi:hypothetical protein
MRFWVRLNEENFVIDSAIGEDDSALFFKNYVEGNWIETFQSGKRNVFAEIGSYYDEEKDVFILKKPYLGWILNPETLNWEPPTQMPEPQDGKNYYWNEEAISWVEIKE